MPWENIGSIATGSYPREASWIEFTQTWAIQFIKFVCGPAPAGCEIGVMWHDHDLGTYPSPGVCWEYGVRSDAPWDYIAHCERVLDTLNEAVEWADLKAEFERAFDDEEEPFEDEEN